MGEIRGHIGAQKPTRPLLMVGGRALKREWQIWVHLLVVLQQN